MRSIKDSNDEKFNEYQSDKNLKGIIIDNTNPLKKNRDEWIDMLTDKKIWKVKIIFINILKIEAVHLTKYRLFHSGKKIPSIAINIYYKNLEIPSKDEGEIIELNYSINNHDFNYNLRFN